MAEIDLVPAGYRRLLAFQRQLRNFAALYVVLVLCLGLTRAALAYGVRGMEGDLDRIAVARAAEQQQQQRLDALRSEHAEAERRLRVLSGLRGGVAARDMFSVIDRASDGRTWFLDWKFRRAGEVVDRDPEAVQTGFFLVVPLEGEGKDSDKAWLMQTHMEIRGRAIDHGALAGFVRRLVQQPEIEEVKVLSTGVRPYTSHEVVDFDLAVVVRTTQ